MENSIDNIMLLAKCDEKIVGCASLNRLPRRMNHRGDFAICVAKDYWNKGIGSQLMDKIISFARENDFKIIDLQVRSDNKNAIYLYEKCGFKTFGVWKKSHYFNGEYSDEIFMNILKEDFINENK